MCAEEVIHLNRYHHFTELMRDSRVEGDLRRYQSDYDGTMQSVLTLRPADRESDHLFFFFHGMDGDCGDAVVVHELVTVLNTTVVAMGGRGPAWISDAFLGDAEQVIRARVQASRGFHLAGVSMGGTQALSLAGLLPDDLRQSILGVIALIPGAELVAIQERSSNERVRNTILESAGGDASRLTQMSPSRVIDQYRPGLPFVIVHNRNDTLLLTEELQTFITRLRAKRHPVATFSAPGDHDFTYHHFDYQKAFLRLGIDSPDESVPLLSDES